MKKYTILLAAFAFLVGSALAAEESAVVTEFKINVRGQPSLVGEVVTQLQKGEKVTVLDRVTTQNPKPGEPTNWAKIKLPANVPVWAFNPFIKNGAVAVTRLNLRAGPGENYSVIGRIPKGTAVKEIRTVDQWTEVEAPPDAYAFVDSSLIKTGSEAAPVLAATPPSRPKTTTEPPALTAPEVVTNKPPAVASPETQVAKAQPTAQPIVPEPTTTTATPAETKPATNEVATLTAASPSPQITPPPIVQPTEEARTSPPPSTNPPPVAIPQPTETTATKLPQVAAAPTPKSDEPLPKRIVRREGFVRPTVSIQAPTWFELANSETKRTMNYLHEEKLTEQGISLKDFRGIKVIVTGEEAIDERWPKVPILEVETIESAP